MNVCLLSVIVAAACFPYVKIQADGVSLLYTSGRMLKKTDLETGTFIEIATSKMPDAIDYHYEKGLVVWTDALSKKIFSFVLGSNGPINELVDVCARPTGVAVDWFHDNLYWTDADKPAIGVARLDGSSAKTLFDKDMITPRSIAIDPFEGLIFWTDKSSEEKIERAGMDGTHRTVINVSGILVFYASLAIDTVSRAIYWTHDFIIYTCSYSGTDLRAIVTFSTFGAVLGLDVLEDWLYFSRTSIFESNLYKIDWHGSNNSEPLLISGEYLSPITRLKVYDSSKQMPGVNICVNNGGCSHLCLPAPLRLIKEGDRQYTCACPDDVLPSDNCSTIPKVTSDKPENSFPTGTIMGITSGIVILALIIFYLYKRFSMKSEQDDLKSQNCKGVNNPAFSEIEAV